MNILTKMLAEKDGYSWIELHWIAHNSHLDEYIMIRDLFWAWEPDKFDINIREIEMEYPGGTETMLLGEFYGQKK